MLQILDSVQTFGVVRNNTTVVDLCREKKEKRKKNTHTRCTASLPNEHVVSSAGPAEQMAGGRVLPQILEFFLDSLVRHWINFSVGATGPTMRNTQAGQ